MKSRLKDWLEFARFAVKHPGIIGHMNYKVDENVDRLLNTLIEDKYRVTLISRGSYTIDLKYKGYTIFLWRTNIWYGYLSRASYQTEKLVPQTSIWESKRPSRMTMMRFFKAFDIDPLTEIEENLEEFESLLQKEA